MIWFLSIYILDCGDQVVFRSQSFLFLVVTFQNQVIYTYSCLVYVVVCSENLSFSINVVIWRYCRLVWSHFFLRLLIISISLVIFSCKFAITRRSNWGCMLRYSNRSLFGLMETRPWSIHGPIETFGPIWRIDFLEMENLKKRAATGAVGNYTGDWEFDRKKRG